MIEIKVTGDTAKEVFTDLQELTAQATPAVNQEAVQAIAEAVANPEAPKAESKPKPKAKAKPEPVEEKPAEAPVEEVVEAPKAENVKLSDVQNALAKILREQPEHKSAAAEILKNHGVKRVSELKEEDFATVKAELESIGD